MTYQWNEGYKPGIVGHDSFEGVPVKEMEWCGEGLTRSVSIRMEEDTLDCRNFA